MQLIIIKKNENIKSSTVKEDKCHYRDDAMAVTSSCLELLVNSTITRQSVSKLQSKLRYLVLHDCKFFIPFSRKFCCGFAIFSAKILRNMISWKFTSEDSSFSTLFENKELFCIFINQFETFGFYFCVLLFANTNCHL